MAKMADTSGEKTYRFIVFSNPTAGNEALYLDWYRGQHIHDLLRIEGFVAAQMFKLADVQYRDGAGIAALHDGVGDTDQRSRRRLR